MIAQAWKKKNRDKAAYDESTDLDYIANLEKKLEDANKKIAAEREKNNTESSFCRNRCSGIYFFK